MAEERRRIHRAEAEERCAQCQEQLAFGAGVARNFLSDLGRGEKCPTLRTLDKLAEALDVSPLDLLHDPAT
jgi:transcriptional regulator with XRE-family HTH domain